MFVNKLKMDGISEAVKKCMAEDDKESCADEVKKHEKRLHGKDGEVSKHVEKMHKEETVAEAEKVKTATGVKVYGSSYGNSERARREQLKRPVDDTKGPNKSELSAMAKVKKEDVDFGLKDKLIEALKGKQHKIDKNKNDKIDSQDFAILRGQQKEEVEQVEEKHMTDADKAEQERIVKGMKKGFAGFRQRYGKDAKSVMYATATKQAMKEDAVEEEIDPKVRTKDTLAGRKPTEQDDDVGPGSNGKSTKVKFRGGPMKEEVKKSDVPAFLRKARGDKPLTVADAKSGSKDSISSKENLAKARGVSEGKQPETDNVPFEKPYNTTSDPVVTDKSGAKHTPMSRAKDLARSAMKRLKTEMLGKAPGNN